MYLKSKSMRNRAVLGQQLQLFKTKDSVFRYVFSGSLIFDDRSLRYSKLHWRANKNEIIFVFLFFLFYLVKRSLLPRLCTYIFHGYLYKVTYYRKSLKAAHKNFGSYTRYRARISKLLRCSGIVSKESIPAAYV